MSAGKTSTTKMIFVTVETEFTNRICTITQGIFAIFAAIRRASSRDIVGDPPGSAEAI
jgi:hypothetical protein